MSKARVKHHMVEIAFGFTVIVYILCVLSHLDAVTSLLMIIVVLLFVVIDILNCLLEKVDTALLLGEIKKEGEEDE